MYYYSSTISTTRCPEIRTSAGNVMWWISYRSFHLIILHLWTKSRIHQSSYCIFQCFLYKTNCCCYCVSDSRQNVNRGESSIEIVFFLYIIQHPRFTGSAKPMNIIVSPILSASSGILLHVPQTINCSSHINSTFTLIATKGFHLWRLLRSRSWIFSFVAFVWEIDLS